MAKFRVNWNAIIYGYSFVDAKNFQEAEEKAKRGEDYGFREEGAPPEWEIGTIWKVSDDEKHILKVELEIEDTAKFSLDDFISLLQEFNAKNLGKASATILKVDTKGEPDDRY